MTPTYVGHAETYHTFTFSMFVAIVMGIAAICVAVSYTDPDPYAEENFKTWIAVWLACLGYVVYQCWHIPVPYFTP